MKIIEKDGKDLIIYKFPGFVNKNKKIGDSLEDFEILGLLQNSQYRNIFKVKSKKNLGIYAIKQIPLDLIEKYNLQKEINFLKQCDHPNIIKYYDSFFDKEYIYILMEFVNNGDILSYYKIKKTFDSKIPIKNIWKICLKSLNVLDYIHSLNMNKAIMLNNIFIDDDFNIKIGILNLPSIIENNHLLNDYQVFGESLISLLGAYDKNEELVFSLWSILDVIKDNKQPIDLYKENLKKLYIKNFVKNSSFRAIFNCLKEFEMIKNYFSDSYVTEFIFNDDNKGKIVSKKVLNVFMGLKAKKNEEEMDDIFYEFREALKETNFNDINYDVEIPAENLLAFILIKLNTELNEIALQKNREIAKKNEDQNNYYYLNKNSFLKLISENIIETKNGDKSTVENAFNKIFNIYNEKFSSLITRNFTSFIKIIHNCSNCPGTWIRFSWLSFLWIPFSQINNYIKAFKDSEKSICFGKKDIKCKLCRGEIIENKSFYKTPRYLIMIIDKGIKDDNQKDFKLLESLNLYNEFDAKVKKYELKGIVTKKIIQEININQNKEQPIKYEYFSHLPDIINNFFTQAGNNKFNSITYGNEEKPIILFYELNEKPDPQIKLFSGNNQEEKQFRISMPKTEINYERQNSNLANAMNINHNINNNIYSNSIDDSQSSSTIFSQKEINLEMQKNYSMQNMNINRFANNQQFNSNNSNNNIIQQFYNNNTNNNQNMGGMFIPNNNNNNNNNNNLQFGQQPNNNMNNSLHQVVPKSLNNNNINYNNLQLNQMNSFPPASPLNQNRINQMESKVPQYTNQEPKANINGYIKGKKFEYPSEGIGLL